MNPMIFDAHCDTAFELIEQKQKLKKNRLHLDLTRMQEYQSYIQVFAAFVDQKSIRCTPLKHCVSILEKMRAEIEENGEEISLIKNAVDMESVVQRRKTGAILSIEGGEALEGNLSNLNLFYQMGIRLITLTWNYANELADGITEPRGGGLTDFGKKAVKTMEEMGILIDVSHLSVKGFWDVAEVTEYPFVASHSCVKALCNHPRNLDDAQIQLLINRNGGLGINFYPEFLTQKHSCTIEDIIRHMEYILAHGGQHILGFGSDFDGVGELPQGIAGVQSMKDIISAMEQRGVSQRMIQDISFGNFYRLFSQTLPGRK